MTMGMDKLDNIVFVLYGLAAVWLWVRCLMRRTPATNAGKVLMLLAIVALATQAVVQGMYVCSVRIPNGWYETSAHLLSVALASMVISMSRGQHA